MFQHYWKIAFRNQAKNKLFSIINLFGLAIGLAVAVLILNYVSFEYSFDGMHSKRDRIYRVESQFYEGDVLTDDWATSSFGYGSAIQNEMTGVEDYVRIGVHNMEQVVSYQEKRSRETGIAYTGPSFFSVFDFQLLEGDVASQLERPNTVVITRDVAHRFFKDENPIGKILTFASGSSFQGFEVTGVIENFPQNSHIRYNYLISYASLPDWMREYWYIHEAYTYVELSPGKNPADLEAAFPQMAEKYKTGDALKNKKWGVSLVPLSDIRLNPQKQYERETKGNQRALVTLVIIAIVILLTAWINYVNLTTARSMERAKDVGVRKVSGAFRLQLIRQYMTESWIVNLLAIVLAAILVLALRPLFNQLIGESVGLFILKEPRFWISTLLMLLLGIVASGFYPAFVMTRVKPAIILKGNYFNSGSAGTTRQILVVFQFAASLFLICGTFIVYKQVRFMQEQDLGVDINQTIVLKYPVSRDELGQKVAMFADNLKQENNIQSATVAGSVPGMEVAYFASNRLQGDETQHRLFEMLTVDDHFVETFDFELAAGRSFQRGFGNDQQNILLNEAALASFGFVKPDEAIGQRVMLEGEAEPAEIIGVVKNWHQRGLSNAHTPIIFLMNGRIGWIGPRFIAVKTAGKDYDAILSLLEQRWNSYFPESSFDYFFLDQFFDQQYKTDRRFGRIVSVFTGLAFFISMLGLWALATFTASKKVKEVGVRKVLGAQVGHVVFLFSKEIVTLLLIAIVIAVPISVFAMKSWLLNYAFRTEISWWVYLLGGALTLGIAMLTIAWQSWKAATRNPVEALRYE